jgi:hypothetical protein
MEVTDNGWVERKPLKGRWALGVERTPGTDAALVRRSEFAEFDRATCPAQR